MCLFKTWTLLDGYSHSTFENIIILYLCHYQIVEYRDKQTSPKSPIKLKSWFYIRYKQGYQRFHIWEIASAIFLVLRAPAMIL